MIVKSLGCDVMIGNLCFLTYQRVATMHSYSIILGTKSTISCMHVHVPPKTNIEGTRGKTSWRTFCINRDKLYGSRYVNG